MRATIGYAIRHPSYLRDWWYELPFRRNAQNPRWWRWLLFEPGQGWLRWGTDTAWSSGGYLDPPEPYGIAPPGRRLWWTIRYRNTWPLTMRDEDRRLHRAW